MDIATLIGLAAGITCVVWSITTGGQLRDFFDVASIVIVIGGGFSALLINFPIKCVLGMMNVVKNCFLVRLPSQQEVIKNISDMAATSRRDGLLALEKSLDQIKDPFLKRGVELVIDGSSKEAVEELLSLELHVIQERHKLGRKILDQLAALFPAFGMIGTLIGLIQMLRTLDDPSKIGGGMAIAMITTFYGSLLANLLCIPLAGKLEARSKEEVALRELMIIGLASMVDGDAPRTIESKLQAFLTPKIRSASAA